ncbi:putative colanic acid biosynthesis domain protein [Escherichia coli 7-233-03_S1_C3]|nr:putative colanic acid biosynthesis domain protein [Escherichia coli 7-233-03_S1_C3]
MPFKKLSRRTFLTASSALAFLHTPFARALPARQSVNINDYNPHDWIASFKQAFSEGQTVVVPAGLVCDNINTDLSSFLLAKRYTSLEACAATAEGDLSYRMAAR